MIYKKGTATKHKVEKFDLDETNHIFVKELGSKDFQNLKAKYPDDAAVHELTIAHEVIARCVVDEDGKPIFSDAADVEFNFNVGLSAIWAVRDKILDLSRSKASEKK